MPEAHKPFGHNQFLSKNAKVISARGANMVNRIIQKLFAKAILSILAVISITLIMIFGAEFPAIQLSVFSGSVVLYIAIQAIIFWHRLRNNKVVGAYGVCVVSGNAGGFFEEKIERNKLYQFETFRPDNKTSSVPLLNDGGNICIKAAKGKFAEGAAYCFLFYRLTDKDVYDETNLIGYEMAQIAEVSPINSDSEDILEVSVSELPIFLNSEETAVPEAVSDEKDNLIYFKNQGEK